MQFNILTIFPEIFTTYLEAGILGRAQKEKLIDIGLHNIRDYAEDKHKTVDDTPYGGGAGMVLKIEPIDKAIKAINDQSSISPALGGTPPDGGGNFQTRRTVVLSARGKQFDQRKAEEYAKLDQLILICGRYEGIDQRVADHLADEELSVGPYVLNGGEVPAMVIIEAASRLIPGVLKNPESLLEESYTSCPPREAPPSAGRSGEYPQYTKPSEYNGWKVPEILLSGDHAEIKKWREKQQKLNNT